MTKEDGIKNFILRTNSKFFLSCFLVNILLFVGLLTTDRLYIDDMCPANQDGQELEGH